VRDVMVCRYVVARWRSSGDGGDWLTAESPHKTRHERDVQPLPLLSTTVLDYLYVVYKYNRCGAFPRVEYKADKSTDGSNSYHRTSRMQGLYTIHRPVHELPIAVSSEDEADSLHAACSHPPAATLKDSDLVLADVKKQTGSLRKQAKEAARLQHR
jgi:hypothetical protein